MGATSNQLEPSSLGLPSFSGCVSAILQTIDLTYLPINYLQCLEESFVDKVALQKA